MESERDSETVTYAQTDSVVEDVEAKDKETRKRLVDITRELCEYGAEFRNGLTEWQNDYKK